MMAGRNIETCPKDGTEFLAYDPEAKRFDVCEWYDFLGGRVISTQKDGYAPTYEGDFQADRATLWWPLPVVE